MNNIFFAIKLNISTPGKMIFPVADLVPDICVDLSVRDIRAIACTSRDVRGMMAPFMKVRVDEVDEDQRTCRILHTKTIWPRLQCILKHEITIISRFFRTDTLWYALDHTGVITIICDVVRYRHHNKSYVCVRGGMARYCITGFRRAFTGQYFGEYVFAIHESLPFAKFIDILMAFILYGETGSGYIDSEMRHTIHMMAVACGYAEVYKFIESEDFREHIIQL